MYLLLASLYFQHASTLVTYSIGITIGPQSIIDKVSALISEFFDLRRPIYRKTALYGHFGRDNIEFPWERTDKAEALKQAAGL